MTTMLKFWRMLRVGGATLRWANPPEEIRKYDDLTWRDVEHGQTLAFIMIVAPIVGTVIFLALDCELLAYSAIATAGALIAALIRPIRYDE